MRQALVWSLGIAVLVLGLTLAPVQPGYAGDPDIPQAASAHPHTGPGSLAVPVVSHPSNDSALRAESAVIQPVSSRADAWWKMVMRWLMAATVRPGH